MMPTSKKKPKDDYFFSQGKYLKKLIDAGDLATIQMHLSGDFNGSETLRVVNSTVGGQSPFFYAVLNNKLQFVRYFLRERLVDMEQRCVYYDSNGNDHVVSPLWCAVAQNHEDVVKILLDYGADVNTESDSESTALRAACVLNLTNIAQILLKRKADPNVFNMFGGTCFLSAVQNRNYKLCKLLLENGCEPSDVTRRILNNSGQKDIAKLLQAFEKCLRSESLEIIESQTKQPRVHGVHDSNKELYSENAAFIQSGGLLSGGRGSSSHSAIIDDAVHTEPEDVENMCVDPDHGHLSSGSSLGAGTYESSSKSNTGKSEVTKPHGATSSRVDNGVTPRTQPHPADGPIREKTVSTASKSKTLSSVGTISKSNLLKAVNANSSRSTHPSKNTSSTTRATSGARSSSISAKGQPTPRKTSKKDNEPSKTKASQVPADGLAITGTTPSRTSQKRCTDKQVGTW